MLMIMPTAFLSTAADLLNNHRLPSACLVWVSDSSIVPIHHLILLRNISNLQWPFLFLIICSVTWLPHVKQSALIQTLLSTKTVPDSSVDDLEQAVDFYKEDLPNADLVDEEYQATYGSPSSCQSPNRKDHRHSVTLWSIVAQRACLISTLCLSCLLHFLWTFSIFS